MSRNERGVAEGPLVINAGPYRPEAYGGLVRYIGEIVGEMVRQEPSTRVLTGSVTARRKLGPAARPTFVPWSSDGGFKGNLSRLAWHTAVLPGLVRAARARVYYSPVPEGMVRPPCPQVVTVHDLIPLYFSAASPRLVHYYRHILPSVLRASAAIIAVSHATATDLRAHFDLADIPIHVVHQGYRSDLFRSQDPARVRETTERYGLREYVLAVGETRLYKNIGGLIRAFALLGDRELRLVVVGAASRRDGGLPELATNLGIGDRVVFLGQVDDAELAALYGGARAFVFPSLYEGFGIPPLEAMGCGCPVIASRAASIPEVCGDAAMYMDAMQNVEIAAAIERVVASEAVRDQLRTRGFERVKEFSYPRAAEQILQIVRGCAR